ncbi:MAG: hypothetical protein ABI402_06965 [Ferruginibacter sp.]
MNWKHYLALGCLLLTGILFYKNHQLGTLSLGLLLIIGYFGFLSFSPTLHTISFGIRPRGFFIPFFNGQPIIIILAFVHFVLSGRYYFGILTKKYWQTFLAGKEYSNE